jgi:uncharacterized protein involved in exopolysaccharide biosynthesis
VDELAIDIVKNLLNKIKISLEKNIKEKNDKLAIIGDSILILKNRYGIYNIETQGEVFADQMLKAESQLAREEAKFNALNAANGVSRDTLNIIGANLAGYRSEVKTLKERIKNYNEGQARVLVLERRQKDMSNKLSVEQVDLSQLITAYNSEISAINLVEAGQIPIIKSRPKRSLIVLSAVFVTFIFSFIGVLLFESYKEVDWKKVVG